MRKILFIIFVILVSMFFVSCNVIGEKLVLAEFEDNVETNCTRLKECGLPMVGNSVKACVNFMTSEKALPEYEIKACRDYHKIILAINAKCKADLFDKYGNKNCNDHDPEIKAAMDKCTEKYDLNQKKEAQKKCLCDHLEDYRKDSNSPGAQGKVMYLESICRTS